MTWWPPTSSDRPGRLALALALLLAAGAACGPSRAELEADRGRLRAVLNVDGDVSRALHRADQAMATSQRDEARRLVLGEAKPVASENARRAEGVSASTDWGKARKAELQALARDRASSLDEYAAAMTSGDVQRVLDALERQRDIERRAVALSEALEHPP
jgi:hypothetical protein